jgi:hypothetical protein
LTSSPLLSIYSKESKQQIPKLSIQQYSIGYHSSLLQNEPSENFQLTAMIPSASTAKKHIV